MPGIGIVRRKKCVSHLKNPFVVFEKSFAFFSFSLFHSPVFFHFASQFISKPRYFANFHFFSLIFKLLIFRRLQKNL